MKYTSLLIALGFLYMSSLIAQNDPVSWSFSFDAADKESAKLILTAELEDGWYIYSQYLESDEGPEATYIDIPATPGLELVDKALEEGTKIEGYDDIFGMNIVKYKDLAKFIQKIKFSKDLKEITGSISYMTCDDEKCLPPKTLDFQFNLN